VARNPTRIGRYDLITALATGGMGRIYLGRAIGIGGFDRKVVIKTLEVPITADSDPAIAMFLDEARLLGLLHHQHITSIFEVGRDDDGRHYMVLDYVEGFSAHDIVERALQFGTTLPLDFTLTVVSAAANGLHYTHTRKDIDGTPLGIVHRDVTPSNVMVGHDGAVKLIDFGIAMAANRKTKTQTGFVKGKVSYLSPEQVAGRDVDARTDVFALGILLYELTTLHRAFRDSSDLATMQRIKQGKLVRPSQLVADYPVELESIVMRALQVDPRDRFGDADAMRRAIEALGHRLRFVLGDAAVIEIMAQLFEPNSVGVNLEPPARTDPAFEWAASDQDLTVRRDPQELIEVMRAHQEAGAKAPKPAALPAMAMKPRKLRAATEAAEALIVQSLDAPLMSPGLPLASPPPTPEHTPLPAVTAASTGKPFPAVNPANLKAPSVPALATPAPAGRPISAFPPGATTALVGAGLVNARSQRMSLRWISVGAGIAVAAAAAGYLVMRDAPKPAAGSAAVAPPAVVAPPVAARAPQTPPAPAKPVHPPAPPPLPTAIRVQIVTHPADATVYLDGKRLGHTPFDETIAADPAKHVFKLKRRGYAMSRLDLELSADITQELALTPQR
jgi:serine/threonine-protein kinase